MIAIPKSYDSLVGRFFIPSRGNHERSLGNESHIFRAAGWTARDDLSLHRPGPGSIPRTGPLSRDPGHRMAARPRPVCLHANRRSRRTPRMGHRRRHLSGHGSHRVRRSRPRGVEIPRLRPPRGGVRLVRPTARSPRSIHRPAGPDCHRVGLPRGHHHPSPTLHAGALDAATPAIRTRSQGRPMVAGRLVARLRALVESARRVRRRLRSLRPLFAGTSGPRTGRVAIARHLAPSQPHT